jgi:hypothetical protein
VSRRRFGLVAAIALALAVAALAGAFGSAQPPALVLGGASGPAITIDTDPVGLSIEYWLLGEQLGNASCPPAALVRALRALGVPTLRIGGDSSDQTAPTGTPRQPGLSRLPSGFWGRLRCLERETGVAVVVGLNLAWGKPAWAAQMVAGARRAVPRSRLSFELGNEPDIYGEPVAWWNGRALVSAAMPFATYLARATTVEALLGAGARIEGPDFASGRWVAAIPSLARTLHYDTLDAHYYPLEGCNGHHGASAAALLSHAIQRKLDERVRIARDARAAGLPAVISEANSVSCGGAAGVSDQPAAAVWAVRTVLTALRDGFSSVRFHSSGRSYDPFVVSGQTLTRRPLFSGLQFAAAALTRGARLQALAGAGAFDGVEIERPDATRTVLLSNYGAKATWVALHAQVGATVVSLASTSATATTTRVSPQRGLLRVELAPDSVVAITLAA